MYDREARVVALADEWRSDAEISELLAMPKRQVAHIRHKHGRVRGGPREFRANRYAKQYAEVKALSLQGLPPRKIAEKLPYLTTNQIARTLRSLRGRGELPTPRGASASPRLQVDRYLQRHDIKQGLLRHTLEALTHDQREWLAKQIPVGATMADAITAILRDVYEEETGGA